MRQCKPSERSKVLYRRDKKDIEISYLSLLGKLFRMFGKKQNKNLGVNHAARHLKVRKAEMKWEVLIKADDDH